VIAPIATGVQSYEENIDNALKMLKAAGVDELIAEFQKQLDASK
jgi:putative aldouronate transport system substrate-binding protein